METRGLDASYEKAEVVLVFIPFGGLHTTPCFLTTGFHLQNKDVPVSLINFNCE